VSVEYLELADYLAIAADITGLDARRSRESQSP
jgi:hypothetical protein